MKKFMIALMLLCVAFVVNAQESATQDKKMEYSDTWLVTALSDADSIGVGDSVWYYTIRKYTTNKVFADFRIVLDSAGGTADSVLITIKYKTWLNDPWTTATSVKYYGSVDTAFNYANSTAVIADYWQVHVKGYSDDFNVVIDSLYFKAAY